MATPENDALEDLAYATSEGPSDQWEAGPGEDQGDYGDYGDYGDFAIGDSGDMGDLGDMGDSYEPDAGDYADLGEDGLEAEAAQENISREIASLLGAESEDEFFGGIRNFLKKVAPIANIVGKVASFIPHPIAQGVAAAANLVGKVRAEGGTTEDALEAVAEMAARDTRALPLVAGLAARSVLKNTASRLPPAQRQQVARAVTRAAVNLVKTAGPAAIRVLPKVVASVNRTAANSGTPPQVRPRVLARTINRVLQNPTAVRNLSAPSRRARQILASAWSPGYGGQGYGGQGYGDVGTGGMGYGGMGRRPFRGRRIRIAGPATLYIRSDG